MSARTPYRLNVVGPFYVEDQCCTWCGVPDLAPDLFAYDEQQCYVKQQPRNARDLDDMMRVMRSQELGCIRYRDKDTDILRRLTELGEATSCDQITDPQPVATRDEVTFHAAPLIMTPQIIEALNARAIELTQLPSGRWLLRHAGGAQMAEQIQRWLTADASIIDVHWTNAAERALDCGGSTKPF